MSVRMIFLAATFALPVPANAAPGSDGSYRIDHVPPPSQHFVVRGLNNDSDDRRYVTAKIEQMEFAKAHERLEQMAAAGDVWALRMTANLYARGAGVDRSDQRALAYYRLAAQQGDAPSAFALGLAYDRGLSVEPDAELSRYWLGVAERNGDRTMKRAVRQLLAKS